MTGYFRGTLIQTDDGDVPVEELGIGHRVVTLSGEIKPIKWIWHRSYDSNLTTRYGVPLPVRFQDGALADGVPAGDLLVSPQHHIYVLKNFVRTRSLVNGATIRECETTKQIEYFDVELEIHDVIFAQGAPSGSFASDRSLYPDYAEYLSFYPKVGHFDSPRYGRYLHPHAPKLSAIRRALLRRAQALGYGIDVDPDVHLIADGTIVRPIAIIGRTYRFLVPSGTDELWLASRSTVAADFVPADRDVRRLGVPVERMVLHDDVFLTEKHHGDPALRNGFHKDEPSYRWTDGRGRLPVAWLKTFAGAFTLEVHLAISELRYLRCAERSSPN